jgi:hypothetical protein
VGLEDRPTSTRASGVRIGQRSRAAFVVGLSAMLLAGIIVATATLGLGLRTTYGSSIDATLGAQVQRDFLADQDAEASALSNGDPSLIGGRLTEGALVDVNQQISDQSTTGATPTVSFQPASLDIERAQDPADPSLVIEVREDGTKTVMTSGGPDSSPSERTISFHADFWLRKDASGRYLIADQKIQILPASNLPAIALGVVAMLWFAIAAILVVRRRHPQATSSTAAAGLPTGIAAVVVGPPLFERVEPSTSPPPEVEVRTFGGLHVIQGGKDWAGALSGRTVTAFVWLRLLVATIRDPLARPAREELGRQASPVLDRETQLKRLRNVISQGLPELPPALRDRIVIEPQVMSFNLASCEVDAVNLLVASAEYSGRKLLSDAQAARAQRVLNASVGTFLPEFETVEDLATDHHPTCTALIGEVRDLLGAKRLELTLLLADSHLAKSRPGEAIQLLEPAFRERVGREDVRARLAAAYRSAGREADVSVLEARLPLRSEVVDKTA